MSEPLITSPEFGDPHFSTLLKEAQSISPAIIGPGEHGIVKVANGSLLVKAWLPIELPDNSKGQDRVFTGFIAKSDILAPLVIVADGVSEHTGPDGNVYPGGDAAHESALGVLEVLARELVGGLDFPDVTDILKGSIANASRRLNDKDVKGATTLLLAMLYPHRTKSGEVRPAWYTLALGDGRITVISRIKSSKWPHERQFGGTLSVVHASGISAEPLIGAQLYMPGDRALVASDGIDGFTRRLFQTRKIGLGDYIEEQRPYDLEFPDRVKTELEKNKFLDDVSIGIITTRSIPT